MTTSLLNGLRLSALSAFAMLAACADPGPNSEAAESETKHADAVYLGAKVFTSNEDAPWAEAIAVKDDALVYVGDAEGASAFVGADTATVDLAGKMILPGLIDAHVHPGFIARFNALLPLPEAENRDAQIADIEQMIADHPDAPYIHGIGWDNRFFGTEGPSKEVLDAIEPDRPVLLHDITMHSLWVNSKALEVAGVGPEIEDPLPGVAYYKRSDDGELTGYITESAATEFVAKAVPLGASVEAVLEEFINYLSQKGVSTLFDAGNFGADDSVYALVAKLADEGRLPVRYHGAYAVYLPNQVPTAIADLKALGAKYNSDRVRIDTLKVFYDGVVETRAAHMLEDYSDMPGNRGGALFGEDVMRQLALDLDREGLHMHVHAIGDRAVRTTLNAIEGAREELGRPLRIRVAMTHLQVVDPADFDRFGELDVIGQFTPAWHGYDTPFYVAALGARVNHAYPAAALRDGGATLSFSSDVYFPSEWRDDSASPFTGIQVGHTRQFRGEPLDGPITGPENEKLSIEDMLTGYTMGSAKQLAMEASIGSLEVGKKADFIVLNEDLFTIDPSTISDITPAAVVLDGDVIQGALD